MTNISNCDIIFMKICIKGEKDVKLPYVYNLKTHTLHIEGFCHHTFEGMHYGEDYKCFPSEEAAVAYDQRSVSMCKLCMRKRENIIKKQK